MLPRMKTYKTKLEEKKNHLQTKIIALEAARNLEKHFTDSYWRIDGQITALRVKRRVVKDRLEFYGGGFEGVQKLNLEYKYNK